MSFSDDNDNVCVICLDKLDICKGVCSLDCGHSYHTSCLLNAFSHDNRCPVCRVELVKKDSKPEGSAVLEIQLNDNHDVYLESRRALRNYNSRVNRYVNKHAHIKKKRDDISAMKKDINDWGKFIEKEWGRLEREAWNRDEMKSIRLVEAKKKRQLKNMMIKYNNMIEDSVGERPSDVFELVSLETVLQRRLFDNRLFVNEFLSRD
tara:strand:+ start:302 stop:919 length:618 start_codon:yes stop_codon:yes gene_type:complete